MIEIAAYSCISGIMIDYPTKENKTSVRDIPEEKKAGGMWYLHGDLEIKLGTDRAVIVNCPELTDLNIKRPKYIGDFGNCGEIKEILDMYLNGKFDVKVYGIEEDCVGYFWTTNEKNVEGSKFWIQRGLVCMKNDTESIIDAEEKYKNKINRL